MTMVMVMMTVMMVMMLWWCADDMVCAAATIVILQPPLLNIAQALLDCALLLLCVSWALHTFRPPTHCWGMGGLSAYRVV